MSVTSGTGSTSLATTLPADPFTDLAVQFGMLLGVADFDALAANPRGKMRLHNAWLHGQGVGLGLPGLGGQHEPGAPGRARARARRGRPRAVPVGHVLPGPRRLVRHHVGGPERRTDRDHQPGRERELRRLCRGPLRRLPRAARARHGVAVRRVGQRHRLLEGERDGRAAAHAEPGPGPPGHLPRAARAARRARDRASPTRRRAGRADGIAALPEDQRAQGWLDQLRAILATEIEAMAPPGFTSGQAGSSLLFPADEPADVVLAQLTGITLTPAADGTRTASVTVHRYERPLEPRADRHHRGTAGRARRPRASAGGAVIDAGGPRIDPSTAAWDGDSIVVTTSGTFLAGTLAAGTSVASIDPAEPDSGWSELQLHGEHSTQATHTLALTLDPPRRRPACGSGFWCGARARRR